MTNPAEIPRYGADASLALLRKGYAFIPDTCDRLGSDAFRTRIMGRDVICMRGPAAAALAYGGPVTRVGAMPGFVLRLLQGKGSVQQLNGDAHRHRKAMFIALAADPARVKALIADFHAAWDAALPRWQDRGRIVLLDELPRVLTEAACRWSGITLAPEAMGQLAGDLAAMVDNAGRLGPRNWLAQLRRTRAERLMQSVIAAARSSADTGTPLHMIAHHRDLQGDLLSVAVAAIEMLNILRPIVAIGRYIAFAAAQMHREPSWCALFRTGADGAERLLDDFVEELRRLSPFFPFVGAVTTGPVTWRGHDIPAGQWLLCDLYGTTHDARYFPDPHRLMPARMLSWRDDGFTFIPQGAGDMVSTHRCPGEMVTVALMKAAVMRLCAVDYDMPAQDLGARLNQIPARPASGVILANLRARTDD